MAQQVGSRRSMVVSLILTIAIAFGSLVATLSLGWGPKLGLDLAGGLSVVYKPATHASNADMQEVVTILNNRVNGLGVSGAAVNLQGKNVVVSVPGVKNARRVLTLVGETAQLLFRPVLCQVAEPTAKAKAYKGSIPTCASTYLWTEASSRRHAEQFGRPDTAATHWPVDPAYCDRSRRRQAAAGQSRTTTSSCRCSVRPGTRYLLGPSELTGQSIGKAIAQQDQVGAVGRELHPDQKGQSPSGTTSPTRTSTRRSPSNSTVSSNRRRSSNRHSRPSRVSWVPARSRARSPNRARRTWRSPWSSVRCPFG